MIISQNKVAVIRYTLTVDGEIVDNPDQEFDYIHGTKTLLPKFEQNVEGLQEGDTFEMSISPEDAYGEYDPEQRVDLPKTAFAINGEVREDLLVPGRMIPMLNSTGDVCRGIVIEVRENDVTLDFNSPMAGKTLHFTGEVLSVREATEKELKEGLHGEFLPPEEHHCGGGCNGGCGGGCNGGGCHGGDHEEGCCGGDHEGGCCGGEGGCNCNKEN